MERVAERVIVAHNNSCHEGVKMNQHKQLVIAGIGELLWDVLPHGEFIGGAPINFAYHVTALGARGIPLTTIGQDARGERALAELQQRGVDIAAIAVTDKYPTGFVSVVVEEDGQASYVFPDQLAWDYLQINAYGARLRTSLDAICFGTLGQRSEQSRRVIGDYLDSLGPATVKVFDINLRQNFYSRQVIEASLVRADILKLSEEELPVLGQVLALQEPVEQWLELLIQRYNLLMVIFSRGDKGSLLRTPDSFSDHPGIVTAVKDTIGAGDSFTAAAIIGYLQGLPLAAINTQANKVAAYVCSQQGAMPHLPNFISF